MSMRLSGRRRVSAYLGYLDKVVLLPKDTLLPEAGSSSLRLTSCKRKFSSFLGNLEEVELQTTS